MRVRLNKPDGDRVGTFGLTVGKDYVVLEITAGGSDGVLYRLITDVDQIPGLFSAHNFTIVCPILPETWIANVFENLHLELAPKSWLQEGFWEAYFDDQEPEAIEAFETEKKKMLSYYE